MKDGKLKKLILRIPGSVAIYKSGRALRYWPSFLKECFEFKKLDKSKRWPLNIFNLTPFLQDRTAMTNFEPHYIYHPAWAARILRKNNPAFHVDISSTLSFATIVSAFLPVKFYDYRPAFLNLEGLESAAADLNKLPFADNSISSLSCMHVVEHIGLGRYGDKIDPDGDIKAIKELIRVLAPGGSLLFVVPVGKLKVAFNAHRVYSYERILETFVGLELKEFSLVPDNFKETGMIYHADPAAVREQDWGCGCFWFVKSSGS